MSDNNKFSLDVGYKQLNIIKHALEVYTSRKASYEDLVEEKRLLDKVNYQIAYIRRVYSIKPGMGMAINHEYEEKRHTLIRIAGEELGKRLLEIIENESSDSERQMAFVDTMIEAIMGGADYTRCRTIKQMSTVYGSWIINKVFKQQHKEGIIYD